MHRRSSLPNIWLPPSACPTPAGVAQLPLDPPTSAPPVGDCAPPHIDATTRSALPPSKWFSLSRVSSGEDPRTTVMIKNIPNRLGRDKLVAFINGVVERRIDFIYLRIDFSNNCNFGYAFVNFITVEDLFMFARATLGQKWNLCHSEKYVEISYADLQGKSALVNKFRNSTVMEQNPAWRPRIFFSRPGPVQGLPEPFPPATIHRSANSNKCLAGFTRNEGNRSGKRCRGIEH